jgi:hypothetical protein
MEKDTSMSRKKVIYATDFDKRPAWLRTINAAWEKTYGMGTKPVLDKDELIRAARKATGLHDLGKDFADEPLDRLLYALNTEARLSPMGRFISRQRLINLLAVRLRAEHWFARHPEILETEVLSPWVIVGLQRTGTTKLHRLLTADPDNRVLRSWEAINPAPFSLNGEADKRMGIAKTSERALKMMAPGFFAIHPVEHLAPEEDILLLDATFMSTTPEATMHVPSYAQWLEKTDQSYAYAYGSKMLRLLQWQQPGRRWVLKTPHHLEFLPLIERYYGTPLLIWTHRNLEECIPSFLSMVCHTRAIFSDEVHMHEVADHWVRKTRYMLSRAMEYHNGQRNGDFVHIRYNDLVANAKDQLEKIYDRRATLSGGLAARFEHAERSNPRGKYGVHVYDLKDFGIDKGALIRHNDAYCRMVELLDKE